MKLSKPLRIIILTTLLIISGVQSYADVNQAVDNFFNSIEADVNGPTIAHNQSAGVMSGGGFATRSQSVDLQVGYFTPPSFNTSCGNVNFFSGSFSFMTNTDQLIKFLQNTLMTAGVTAVMTAFKAVSPNIAGTLQSMLDQSNQLMGMFNNSCQLGTALGNIAGTQMGDAYAKTTGQSLKDSADMSGGFINNTVSGSARSITDNMKKVTDAYHDWVNKNANLNPATDSAITQQFATKYGSIIWKGLQAQSKFNIPGTSTSNSDLLSLANLIISLTGDVIIYSPNNDGTGTAAHQMPPQILDIKQFLTGKGSNTQVYNCTYFNPQKPGECYGDNSIPNNDLAQINYRADAQYKGNIVKTIQQAILGIQNYFVSNKPLTSEDLFIIAISSNPIFEIAQTLDDIGMASSINYVLSKYSEQIAFEILQRLVNMSLSITQQTIIARANSETIAQVTGLQQRISDLQSQVNSFQSEYVKTTPVEILQQLNYLKAYAQNQMSPEILQRVNFARELTNY